MAKLSELAEALEITGVDSELFQRALTHRSYSFEHGGVPHSERIEFLGDSVLGLVVSTKLYKLDAQASEGDLSRQRSSVVSTEALAEIAEHYRIGDYLRLGKGEEQTGGRHKHSLLADATESIIGATYLSLGMDAAWALVERLTQPLVDRLGKQNVFVGSDPKTALQELTAERGMGVPEYSVTSTGPDHNRHFEAIVSAAGAELGRGGGHSRKAAEKVAARQAWEQLNSVSNA